MIKLEKRGRRIVVMSQQPLAGFRTAIPGAYQSTAGHWTVPLSIESCRLLKERYGKALKPGNELVRWVRSVQANRKSMAELARKTTARLDVVPTAAPRLYKAMRRRKYQLVGARFIADNPQSLLADDPGLGKTLIAMAGILEAEVPGPYLVVAPKTAARSVWEREIKRWLPEVHRTVVMPEFRLQRERRLALSRFGRHTWLIVHPEMLQVQSWLVCTEPVPALNDDGTAVLEIMDDEDIPVMQPCGVRTSEGTRQARKLNCGHMKTPRTKKVAEPSYPRLFEIEFGAVVVDESHESLIRRKGTMTQRRRGLEMLKVRSDGLRIASSGTPFDSKPEQLWGTLNWLDPVMYSAYHRWAELYWQKGGYTGHEIGEFRKDREEMLWDSLSAIALRRTKAEVAPDLPPKVEIGSPLNPDDPSSPVGIWLDMDGKQEKAYRQMEELSVAELDSGRIEATVALVELTRLKQLACAYGDLEPCTKWVTDSEGHRVKVKSTRYVPRLPSNKFAWTIEALEEWGYPRNPLTKVVIVSFFTGILEMFRQGIEAHFKTKPRNPLCTSITGRVRNDERAEIIERFNQSGNEHVMLLNVKAGGTAITIDSADRMIFISETRIPDQQIQAENRIHRVSNPRHCMYYYLRTLGTVDVGTALINQELNAQTHRLLDARRGVDYVRHVMDLSHAEGR
jgi:SNF2 family DNA or RNA helicase